MHVPICVPSAEQTDCPAVAHEALELVGAEAVGALLGEAAEGATEGATAGTLDGAAGVLELSEGVAAAAEGTTTATFSCTGKFAKAAEGDVAAADDEDCTTDDPLDCPVVLSLSPEPPGTVQPIGVHSIPCTLPLPFGAIVSNKSGVTSRSPNAQP